MARVRSPNYPAISLPEAIRRAQIIHQEEQHLAAPKEVIAKHLGFGGLNGGSNRMISALTKYGLLEEVSGDKVKISPLAISILHPANPAEKTAAINEAALKPPLFAEIASEWGGSKPSDANLRTYLIRRQFASDALDRVIQAYKDTIELVTHPESDYNKTASKLAPTVDEKLPMSEGRAAEPPKDSSPKDNFIEEEMGRLGPIGPGPLSQRLKVMMTGARLRVSADLGDTREVDKLIKILEANKALIGDPDEIENVESRAEEDHG